MWPQGGGLLIRGDAALVLSAVWRSLFRWLLRTPPRHHDFSMLSSLNLHKEMLTFQDTDLLNIVLELTGAIFQCIRRWGNEPTWRVVVYKMYGPEGTFLFSELRINKSPRSILRGCCCKAYCFINPLFFCVSPLAWGAFINRGEGF